MILVVALVLLATQVAWCILSREHRAKFLRTLAMLLALIAVAHVIASPLRPMQDEVPSRPRELADRPVALGFRREPMRVLTQLFEEVRYGHKAIEPRRELAGRLGRTAVVLRAQREAIPLRRAWDEIEGGEWPPHPALAAVLRPCDIRTPPLRRGDHLRTVDRAVSALWNYAQGGKLDDR